MDANRGEAERCLREAERWQRQNRPVKALKFAKKSHSLFPTQSAQQKIGELTDLLQARGYQDPSIAASLNNNNNNSNNNPLNNEGLRQRRPPSNPSQARPSSQQSQPSSNHNRAHPPPQNQEFVEIDPNSINNPPSPSILENIQSLEFWSMLLEQIFGTVFDFIYQLCRPILPTTLLNFNLRYRHKVWVLLSITIILLFTRFAIVGRPFGSYNSTNKYHPNSQKYEETYYYETEFTSNGKFKKDKKKKKQSAYEQKKEQYESQYGGKSNRKSSENQYNDRDPFKNKNKNNQNKDNYQDPYYEYNNYDNYGSYNSRGSYNSYNSRSYDARGRGGGGYNNYNNYGRGGYNSGYYSSSGGSWFSPYNLMIMFIMGSMILGMFRRGQNGNDPNGNGQGGFNWNMLMPLMMFGGMPMGGMYGRFGRGGFGRRRGFGRRFF